MKINKNVGLLLGLLLVLSIGLISADAVTLTHPNATVTVNGSEIVLNATNTTTAGQGTHFVNCTFYGRSTATANSTYVNIGNVTNTSAGGGAGDLYLNDTWNSQTDGVYYFEDSSVISIYASCWFENSNTTTAQANSTAITLITLNNSFPLAATTPLPGTGTIDQDGTVTFYATVVGENVTACTLYFPGINPGLKGYTMTHAADNCSYALTTAMPDQTYKWIVQTTDGTEYTNSSEWLIQTDTTRGSHTTPEIQAEWERQQALAIAGEGGIPIWVWIILVVLVLGFILYKRSK